MKITYQDMTYAEALGAAGLECLNARRVLLGLSFYRFSLHITNSTTHSLSLVSLSMG